MAILMAMVPTSIQPLSQRAVLISAFTHESACFIMMPFLLRKDMSRKRSCSVSALEHRPLTETPSACIHHSGAEMQAIYDGF